MEILFKTWTIHLAALVEASAAIIVGIAALEATLKALRLFITRWKGQEASKETIRISLGRWLALALEFELASDVLRTAVAPTWDELGKLAAIIILRTVLNYFLQKEIDRTSPLTKEIPPAG